METHKMIKNQIKINIWKPQNPKSPVFVENKNKI